MNMNIKNEKTMLALIVVAALAMVSVAGVALASESDAGIIVKTNSTTVDADGYEGAISVIAGSTLIIEGNYTGTITFYTNTDSTVLSTIDCTDVSGVIFMNGGSTVTVYGETTGTIELTKGTVTLGGNDKEAFTGILTVGEYGTIDSGYTYGAVITIVPASGTDEEYVSFSGINISAVADFDFESAYYGITNEMLGNDIEITQESDTTTKYISGTLAKIDVDGASAIGTYLKTKNALTEDGYGIICNGEFYAATVVDGKVTVIDSLEYDFSGLTLSDSAASEPGVSGLTGALTINLDATVGTETKLAENSTIVNNGTLTIAGATVAINGVFINNGDMQITEATEATIRGAGSIINYGTFTATSAAQWFSEVEVSGYYVQVEPTATGGTYTTTGYATLADAVAAATGTKDMIVAGGYNYCSEDVTVASTQEICFAGSNALFALDGEGSLTIAGTATKTKLSVVNMIIASEASMDLSAATITYDSSHDHEGEKIDVNGFIVVKISLLTTNPPIITGFGTITADTSVTDTTAGTTTFNNLYIALTATTTGTITLLNDATLNKSATLADGVVFHNDNHDLTIAEGVTMTCDGHFQMTGGFTLEVIGTLVINDSTEIDTTIATPAGSFVGSDVSFILTGTLQVSEGAVFKSVVSIGTGTDTTGDIIVDGALTLDAGAKVDEVTVSSTGAITFTGSDSDPIETTVTTMTVAGTITNGALNTIKVTTMTVTGTFDNTAGTVVVSTLVMTDGTLTTGNTFTVDAKATFGAEGAALTAGDVVNTITIGPSAYVLAYGDFDMSALFGKYISTVFYLGDDVFATEYAFDKGSNVSLDLLEVNVEGKKLVGWYTSPDFSESMITANTGAIIDDDNYKAVYGYLVDKTVEVALSFIQNGTWLVDGQSFGSSGTVTLTYGTYTIQVVADNGYELSDYVVTVDGKTVGDDFKFTIDDDSAITAEYTGKIKEKSESGGLDLITILLIIITIVIVIMAIIIALKLMRS